jgi:(S)-ureidoglycine aminohydrolase
MESWFGPKLGNVERLGHTRTAHAPNHLLHTPDVFVRATLPGMQKAAAIVHISPAGGAAFTQYTAEIEAGGILPAAVNQRFVYVLDGTLTLEGRRLEPGGFAYLPPEYPAQLSAAVQSRAAIIEKPYELLDEVEPPSLLIGRESGATPTYLNDDPWLEVRALIPDDTAFDFRVNTMAYQPGAALPAVESHVMEHGLLMLEGGGIYRLGDRWYPVTAGDFIWMAPYCPQWFGAIGKRPAKYLIYKDWDRHPL